MLIMTLLLCAEQGSGGPVSVEDVPLSVDEGSGLTGGEVRVWLLLFSTASKTGHKQPKTITHHAGQSVTKTTHQIPNTYTRRRRKAVPAMARTRVADNRHVVHGLTE